MGSRIAESPATAACKRTVAGRYRLERRLGNGFLGESYLAQVVEPGAAPQYAVLKILHPERDAATTPSLIATLAACAHPNLAPPFESGVDEQSGRRFVVTHWLDGVDWISAARLAGPQETPYLLAPLCRALAYLHERGLSHGRLHTSNIHVLRTADSRAPRVVLCDFGLATGDSMQGTADDFRSLSWMLLRGLVPGPILRTADELPPGELDVIVRDHVDPASPALAYVLRRGLGLGSEPPFRSPLEILDEVNRRTGLALAIQAPELRQALEFDVRMVGRQRELDRLKMRLEALTGGSLGVPVAPLAVLIGEAGVGKSRLLREFLSQAGKKKLKVASGSCHESARYPYAALEDVVKTLAASLEARREKENIPSGEPHPLVARYGRELVKICPEIGKQHGIAPSEPLEPEQEKMRLIDQTAYFVHDSSRHAPILIAVEDLHWADEGTLDLLRYLCRMGQGGSVQVVATARREEMAESLLKRFIDEGSGDGWLEQIPLQSLGEAELRTLAAEVLELKNPAVSPALEKISRDAEGNPYQLQEILCHLVEEGVLRNVQGKWEIDIERLDSVSIPAKIAEAFLGRIRRLDPPSIRLLQMLATFGRAASVDQLARMLERPRWEVQRQVEALVDRAILDRLTRAHESAYTFRHARQAEALYHDIPEKGRPDLHGRAAAELKEHPAGDDSSHHAELARHLLVSGALSEAFDVGLSAIGGLVKQNAFREAYALATALEPHLARVPRARARFLNLMGECHGRLRRPQEARRAYEEALRAARESDPEEAARSLVGLTRVCLWDRNPETTLYGLQRAREAYRLLCRQDNPPLLTSLMSSWAGYFLEAKRLKVAERMLERAHAINLRGDPALEWTVLRPNQAILAALQGHLNRARALLERALTLAEKKGDAWSLILILGNLVYLAHRRGDFRLGLSYLSRQEMGRGHLRDHPFAGHLEALEAENLCGRGRLWEGKNALADIINRPNLAVQRQERANLELALVNVLLDLGQDHEARRVFGESERADARPLNVEHEFLRSITGVRLARHSGELTAVAETLQSCASQAVEVGNRRHEARALFELLSLPGQERGASDAAELEHRLWEIAADGESVTEEVGARIMRARRLNQEGNLENAKSLLHEAYSLAEQSEARLWSLRVLREQCRLGQLLRDSKYTDKVAALRKSRIAEIARTIENSGEREAFARSEWTSAEEPRAVEEDRESPRSAIDDLAYAALLQSFRRTKASSEGVEAFSQALSLVPAAVATVEDGKLHFSSSQDPAVGDGTEGASAALARSIGERLIQWVQEGSNDGASSWWPMDGEAGEAWSVAAATDGIRGVGMLYKCEHTQSSEAVEYCKMAAWLSLQLMHRGTAQEMREEISSPGGIEPAHQDGDALLLGRSPQLRSVLAKIAIAAKGDVGVMVQGESGTGKELVARRIHQLSVRADKPFLAVDCGAFPENLVESELFGYKRGAFTGADRDKRGLFEEVDGGTLLLDEIGNAGANFQAKLLRVLQEREVRRIGENRTRPVDVRIVAATNTDLRKAVERGAFREDLFYRLSVITIEVPPLRDRREDIPILAHAFLGEIKGKGQKVGPLSDEARQMMMEYAWPGNVRELRNALQAAALAADGAPVGRTHLPEAVQSRERIGKPRSVEFLVEAPITDDSEKRRLEQALIEARGARSSACKILGWNRMRLYRRMKQYQIPADFGKPPRK